MDRKFEVNIRIAMLEHIEQEQAWIDRVVDKFPNLPTKELEGLNADKKDLIALKMEIQAEIDEIMQEVA